jgi:transcriptional regulator with PAS, ATPase and Fis domain
MKAYCEDSALLNHISNAVIVVDRNNCITCINSAAEVMLSIDKIFALGENFQKIIPGFYEIDKMIRSKKTQIGKFIEFNDSSLILNINPLIENDNYYGFVIVLQKISDMDEVFNEYSKTKNLLKTLETVLDHSYEGIVVVDQAGKILSLNKSYARHVHVNEKDAIGKPLNVINSNSKLYSTLETGRIDIGVEHSVGNEELIVMRIPIFKGNEIVGAVGKILFRDVKEIESLLKKIGINDNRKKTKNTARKHVKGARYTFDNIVHNSVARKKVIAIAKRISKTDATVLVTGESGSGKELIAHSIHNESLRRFGSFVSINCAAIPENLMESEFFGYEKGAFTGADINGKAGKFEIANGGTIFLDEIGEMPYIMQGKLLRILQEKEIIRIGGLETIDLDVRIICATNKNLKTMVADKTFRSDLYYRLNVINIELPPLRETKEDIVLLVDYFVAKLKKKRSYDIEGVEKSVYAAMEKYDWPGNVRELRNTVERLASLNVNGMLVSKYLPEEIGQNLRIKSAGPVEEPLIDSSLSLKDNLNVFERRIVIRALEASKGDKARAAEILGISRAGMYQKLKEHGLKSV